MKTMLRPAKSELAGPTPSFLKKKLPKRLRGARTASQSPKSPLGAERPKVKENGATYGKPAAMHDRNKSLPARIEAATAGYDAWR